jgi:2',3'-cyclic-nucleotide 2'-phosphodiesterase (5'-nucleotidase family)
VVPDALVAAAAERFQAALTEKLGEPLCITDVNLDSSTATVRSRETAIGNLFTDAMRFAMRADAAVLNGGGIRAGKNYDPGARLTYGDVLAELPFNNTVVTVEITGRELKRAMENGLSALPAPAGRFPQVSGMKIEFDLKRPPRDRVVSIQVGGVPLEDAKHYRVAVVDFLARGGDDYSMFRDATRITPDNDAPMLINEVVDHLRRLGTAKTDVEGRIVAR